MTSELYNDAMTSCHDVVLVTNMCACYWGGRSLGRSQQFPAGNRVSPAGNRVKSDIM